LFKNDLRDLEREQTHPVFDQRTVESTPLRRGGCKERTGESFAWIESKPTPSSTKERSNPPLPPNKTADLRPEGNLF